MRDVRSVLLLVLLGAGSAVPVRAGAHDATAAAGPEGSGSGIPAALYAEAAQRFGVPEPLLRAMVDVESGGTTRNGEPTRDGRYGLLGLVPNRTLDRAHELTGFLPGELARDPRAGLLGGAAALADLARSSASLEDTLVAWADFDVLAASWDFGARVIALLGPLAEYEASAAGCGAGFLPGGWGPPPFDVDTAHRPDYPDARWVGPACDYTNSSRGSGSIDMVIIHTCEGGFSGCWGWLVGCHDVSAHYVVSTRGDIVQCVEDEDVAWHAGCVNSRSIGIEHEGSSLHPENFTDAMYCASSQLVRFLCDRYGFTCDRRHVIGHGEANDLYCGGTHWDPGPGWDWDRYMEYVQCGCGGCCTPSPETCNDRDDDCDGAVDEDLTRPCGSDVGACATGTETCRAGTWGACLGAVEPAAETCNDEDDDCDGTRDEERVCELEEVTLQGAVLDGGGSTDVDGDGRADACGRDDDGFRCHLASGHGFEVLFLGPALSDAQGWNAPEYGSTLRLGDIDGDGRDDVCARAADGIACWRSTGDSFGERLVGPPLSDAAGWNDVTRYATLRLADFDGDGRRDVCGRAAQGFSCWPSLGDGFGTAVRLAELTDADGWNDVLRFGTIRMGDFDGDGRSDVCARAARGMLCWRSMPDGPAASIAGPAWTDAAGWDELDHWSTIRMADVDGDGRDELCGRSGDGFRCHRWDGGAFGGPLLGPELADADGWAARDRCGTLRLGDVDGDGAADLCARSERTVLCWLWTGTGFDRRVVGPVLADADGWGEASHARTLRLADVTGDGRADVCARGAGGLRCWISDGGGFPTAVRGPDWTDEAGWDDPTNYATIRIGGPDERPSVAPGGTGGTACGCTTAGGRSGAGWMLVVCLAWRGCRRWSSRATKATRPDV